MAYGHFAGTEPTSSSAEPPSSRFQQALPLTLRSRPRAKRIVFAPVRACETHPLLFGAALLFLLSAWAGHSVWGFPTDASLGTIGGADVEEVVVDTESVSVPALSDVFVTSTGIGSANAEPEALASDAEEGLVTVPWTPVSPSGASGRDVIRYVVRDGDTLSTIAGSFGIDANSVAWSNDLVDPDAIHPGDILRIPPVRGVLHVVKSGETLSAIAKRFSAQEGQIIAFNALPADGSIIIGDELVVPGGALPPPPPKPRSRSFSSAPRFSTSQVPLGYYIAPTTGRNYGRRHSHNGVDISNSCGTPIYAAADGTITHADGDGWNGGYGDVIHIAHPNGTETLYAHLSQILVASGHVGQGQLIGLMGTTGRSTGCHLHFEVHGARNPLVR